MNVLGALTGLLIPAAVGPVTNGTGGTSAGDPNAGSNVATNKVTPITTGDRVGAGILTTLVIAAGLAVFAWMSLPEHLHFGKQESKY